MFLGARRGRITPFVFGGLGLTLVSLLFFGLFFGPLTGTVSFDIQADYQSGENLEGTLQFNIKEGELLPEDSKIVVSLGDQSKEFVLSDLVSSGSATGEFFVEGSALSGSGVFIVVTASLLVHRLRLDGLFRGTGRFAVDYGVGRGNPAGTSA